MNEIQEPKNEDNIQETSTETEKVVEKEEKTATFSKNNDAAVIDLIQNIDIKSSKEEGLIEGKNDAPVKASETPQSTATDKLLELMKKQQQEINELKDKLQSQEVNKVPHIEDFIVPEPKKELSYEEKTQRDWQFIQHITTRN